MSSKGLFRRLSQVVVVAATSSVVLASGVGMSSAYAAADHSTGNAGTSGTYNQPQPLSTADQNTGGANGDCVTDPTGIYCSTRDGSPSGNGNQDTGGHTGEPCAGCVGNADNKNPPGQEKTDPLGTFPNNGYECDKNNGIGQSNPAHTGCTTTPPPPTQLSPLTLAGACVTGDTLTWTLTNPNTTAVLAHYVAGATSGDVTVPASASVTLPVHTSPVTVTFPNTTLTAITLSHDSCTTTPPPTELKKLTLTSDCGSQPGTYLWTLTNPNDVAVPAHWSAGSSSGDVTVPANGSTTFTTTVKDVTVSFDKSLHLADICQKAADCPPPVELSPLTLAGTCVTGDTLSWTLTNPNASDVVAHYVAGATSGDITVPAGGAVSLPVHTSPVTVTFAEGTGLAPITQSHDTCTTPPVTQTVSGVIELCNGEMAPSAGSLLTVESTSVSSTNPLAATPVAAGDQKLDAVAPTGYHFVICNATTQTIVTPTTANETVNVPAGGTNQAVFYVEKNETPPPPPPVLSMTVDKTNNADGDQTFSKSETAPSAGAAVPFQVVIANTSDAVEVIDSISDAYSAVTAAECTDLVGTEIQPGHSVTCSFTIAGYAPATGTSLTNTVTVTVHAKGDTGDTLTGTSTSTVTTAAPPPPVLAVNVDKTNNADGVAGFSKTETATAAGQGVPFQVVISNPTDTDEVIDSITDAYASTTAPECADLVGSTLAAHGSVTCSFTIAGYSPAAGGSLTDTVTVVVHQLGNTGNSTSGESSSTVLTPAAPPALTLTVVKSNDANLDGTFHDTETALSAAQAVVFEVRIVNSSPVALLIDSVVDAFSGTTQPECASLVGTTLASGASATCTFTVAGYSPTAGGSLTDLVTVIGHEVNNPGNSTQGSDTSTVLTPTPPTAGAPDLAIVKVASKTSVTAGDALGYTLTVSNVGDSATTGAVTVTDVVPSGLAVTGVNGGTDWTCGTSGQTVTCTFTGASIASGQTVGAIAVSTTVLSAATGTLTNTGTVSTPGDTNPTNDTSTVKTPVTKVLGEKIPRTPGTPGTPGTPRTPGTPSGSPSVLPFTGSNVTALLPGALGMVVVGLLMVVSGRRRRRA